MQYELRRALGLSVESLIDDVHVLNEEESNLIEQSFIESDYELNKLISDEKKLRDDLVTVEAYKSLIYNNELTDLSLESISIGLNHLLVKYDICSDESLVALESISNGNTNRFGSAMDTINNIFQGIKDNAKNIIEIILNKFRAWKNTFINFFRRVFVIKRRQDTNAAAEAVKVLRAFAQDNPKEVKEIITSATTSKTTVDNVEIIGNEVVTTIILDDRGIDSFLFSVEAKDTIPLYKSFLFYISGIVLTVLLGKINETPDKYIYDKMVNSRFKFVHIPKEFKDNRMRLKFGYRYIDFIIDEPNNSIEEIAMGEENIVDYFSLKRDRLALSLIHI